MWRSLLAAFCVIALLSGCSDGLGAESNASRPGAKTCSEWASLSATDKATAAQRVIDVGGPTAAARDAISLASQITVACKPNPSVNPGLIAASIMATKPQPQSYDAVTLKPLN